MTDEKETFENCKEMQEYNKNKCVETAYNVMLKYSDLHIGEKDLFAIGWFTIMKQLHEQEIKYWKDLADLKNNHCIISDTQLKEKDKKIEEKGKRMQEFGLFLMNEFDESLKAIKDKENIIEFAKRMIISQKKQTQELQLKSRNDDKVYIEMKKLLDNAENKVKEIQIENQILRNKDFEIANLKEEIERLKKENKEHEDNLQPIIEEVAKLRNENEILKKQNKAVGEVLTDKRLRGR